MGVWKEQPTRASKIIGLPLLVHKLSPNPAWDQDDHTRLDNQPASSLNLTVDPKIDAEWGSAPPTWQSQVGSVLLVRQDGKELTCKQARALAEYMQHHLSDSFEEAMESGEEKQRRSQVLKMLNWTAFNSFLDGFKAEMSATEGKSWAGVRSPFGTREDHLGQSF